MPFAGFGMIVGISLLLFGLLFIIIGALANYIGLVYDEVKQRPNFIVRETVGVDDVGSGVASTQLYEHQARADRDEAH